MNDEDDDDAARKFFEESERLKRGANRLAAERANQNSIDAALAQIDEEDQEGEDAKDSGHDLAKIHVTFFPNFAATTLTTEQLTLTELADRVRNTARREKSKLPWLKLAVFGSKRTGKNCLRNDANVIDVSGVELDYDLEQISFDDAVAAVRELEIHALLYTSASHTPETPRWRALAPFSKPLPPAMRAKLTARLNGALKAKLNVAEISKSESFALSQSYYFGWINTKPNASHKATVVEGEFIDLRDDLAIYEASGEAATALKENSGNNGADSAAADWGGPVENIRAGVDLHASLRNLSAKLVASGMAAPAAINFLRGLMENSAAPRDERWQDRRAAIPRLVESAAEKFRERDTNPSLGVWNAGQSRGPIPPRGWLLGNIFCRRFLSSLVASGGSGKTALRITQMVALATGKPLTREHIFTRCRVLLITLEDDLDEAARRIMATCLHHGIDQRELDGWMFVAAPGAKGGKLMEVDRQGRPIRSGLAVRLEHEITLNKIDLVCLDPFVKTHSVEENSNSLIDEVVQILADLAAEHDVAIDAPHHVSKGASDPGNARRSRGASSMVDGLRLVYTLNTMSPEEAQAFGVNEAERRLLFRVDSGKVNIAPPVTEAKWFKLVGVNLGNASDLYPAGDNVQAVEVWSPPKTWGDLSIDLLNRILTAIDAGLPDGNRYTDAAKAGFREAWRVVRINAPGKTEDQAREIIKTWVKNGVLEGRKYLNPVTGKEVRGLWVNPGKRPG